MSYKQSDRTVTIIIVALMVLTTLTALGLTLSIFNFFESPPPHEQTPKPTTQKKPDEDARKAELIEQFKTQNPQFKDADVQITFGDDGTPYILTGE